MKHSGLILLFSAISTFYTIAQENPTSDTRPIFGAKVGFDINIPGKWHNRDGSIDMYRHGCGVTIGGVCNIYLGKSFFLEPGISLYYDQYSYKDFAIPSESELVENADPKVNKYGIRLPVVVGYAFAVSDQFSFSVFTGPEFNYAFAGKYSLPHKFSHLDFPTDPFVSDRRFDCTWKIGLTVPLSYFHIGIDTSIGITDLLKNPDISFRENRVTVSLTYYFN